ncbi:MAG: YcaO-like family protein [Verrucomicrobia bacterium]|nr:YcaO-like family protein [Verrucomicrobiota bacterium]
MINTGMPHALMDVLQLPQRENGFYLLEPFLHHQHDAVTARFLYPIPWENGLIIASQRDSNTAGCVGCLIRRLLSTVYHKTSNIHRVDSVYCSFDIASLTQIQQWCNDVLQAGMSSTRCTLFRFSSESSQELHVLPVPGCGCSAQSQPKLSSAFADYWLQQWPNLILEKRNYGKELAGYHAYSSRLPNTASLFLSSPASFLHVSNSPTAADFRDSKNLELRLVGESVERYCATFIPLSVLARCEKKYRTQDSAAEDTWDDSVKAENLLGESAQFPLEQVYSGLSRLFPKIFSPLSSSGVAAHKFLYEARMSAALELIERDALLTAWRLADAKHFCPFISFSAKQLNQLPELEWTKRCAEKQSHQLHLIGIKNELQLPIVLAFTLPQEKVKTSSNFGSGIGLTWGCAIRKALCEILQGLAAPDQELPKDVPHSFIERPRYWKLPERAQILKKRFKAKQEQLSEEAFGTKHPLPDASHTFMRAIFFVNLTTPDVALAGWHVVRALCKDFEPFSGSYKFEKPNIERINRFLVEHNVDRVTEINIDPFPFA